MTDGPLTDTDTKNKVLDVRFGINLLVSRYYVVLLMGKERREKSRDRQLTGTERVVNGLVAAFLLISLNVFVSLSLAILLYLIKSAVGIDLFHDQHLTDKINAL